MTTVRDLFEGDRPRRVTMFVSMLGWEGKRGPQESPIVIYGWSLDDAIKAADAVADRLPWGQVLSVEQVES